MLYKPGFSVCILGNMVGKFSQSFSRANTEPPWVLRRLQYLRRWSHEQIK
ncbi:hypothetical protein SAMN05216318_11748 [Nitrosomonas eutropha]|nr:hypothetical protein SAMN05216318_11748 [Nitrosomonas eutropha]